MADTRNFDPESFPVPDLGLQCLGCQYRLTGLMQHRCPECGRPFTLDEHIPPGDWPPLIIDGEEVRATTDNCTLMQQVQIPIETAGDTTTALYGLSLGRPRLAVARGSYWDAVHVLIQQKRGEAVDLPPVVDEADWTCPKCGETNPANFEVCWQCNDNRPK